MAYEAAGHRPPKLIGLIAQLLFAVLRFRSAARYTPDMFLRAAYKLVLCVLRSQPRGAVVNGGPTKGPLPPR